MYSGSGLFGISGSNSSGISDNSSSVDSDEEWEDRTELVLVLLSNLYLLSDSISVGASRFFSYLIPSTDYLSTALLAITLIGFDKVLSLRRECLF